jgi:CRP/FNR family cyclic AMP-dependent transcriptional regulator
MPAELLASSPLFSVLGAGGLAAVSAAARPVELVRSDVLFDEGDDAAAVYVVVSGRIAIVKRAGESGRESVVAVMEQGDVFGEMGLFDGGGRSAQARSLDDCHLLEVPYPTLRAALDSRPQALWAMLALLARRIRATDENLADAMLLDVPGRTAKRLLELAGRGDGFGPSVTQEELAAMVGASRERVNKAIATFVRLGWVEQAGRRYRVLDPKRLADRAR